MSEAGTADLVLVGGGHAHVQVLRRVAMAPLPGVRLCVVLDRPVAVYSGMVPGCLAGDYAAHELEIDVLPLARRAGARVLLAAATGIDVKRRRIALEGRPPVVYDVASFDVGSGVRGLDLPGVREHALATRPIGHFVAHIEERLREAARDPGAPPLRIAVVGAGAAGLELACALRARLRTAQRAAQIHLVSDSARVLEDQPPRISRRAARAVALRGVELHLGMRVAHVEAGVVFFEDGGRLACDEIVWATGAAPHAWLAASALPVDARGFVRIESTLQVVGHPDLFAAGDCASYADHAWVRKAGVYAVRQGPLLDANLRARLRGEGLRAQRPQRDFLTLLNLGGGEALAAKWGLAAQGRAVWRVKDWIDRRFVRRFQVLAADAAPAAGFPRPRRMKREAMTCGGCAAKLAAPALSRALDRLPPAPADPSVCLGLARPDDAAALTLPRGDVLLASLDAFRAFCDDAWLVGRVAAVNAISDVFATGGRPRHALALVTLPETDLARAEETLYQVLSGVRESLDPLRVSLVGGHTTRGDALLVGLAVTGTLEPGQSLLSLDGLRPGQHLLLSKALGTGVVLAADRQGLARGVWLQGAFASMLRPNDAALRVARSFDAAACTDVTGFGLLGHLCEMLRASRASARLRLDALPALDGALALLARGVRSSAHAQNALALSVLAGGAPGEPRAAAELLCDPQTSGGLLFGVAAERSAQALDALRAAGESGAAAIGEVLPVRRDGALVELV
ncbi:MAG: selenide, water dikinase SelD [Myxococcales bacterium]|nr:selenide, water dikinase SelD [Myxococcales bacterium]MDH5306430.1 selenide, water dikinase SelD [Myxococcales bacterium]MDH5565265.1 selenide, water dikinase SelD [Myxococcales bacterium]